jgi:hypothetical protein
VSAGSYHNGWNPVWARMCWEPIPARGFDDVWQMAPSFAVPPVSAEEEDRPRELSCALDEEIIRGSFSAISEIAGFATECVRFDPANERQCRNALGMAVQIEELARGLRLALQAHTRAASE